MNKLFYFSLLLLAFCGCRSYEDSFIIKNQTNKKLTIYGYAVKRSEKMNIDPVYSESFEIQPNSEYIVFKRTGEDDEPLGIFKWADEIDSVVISLNNEKFIRYSCNYYVAGDVAVRVCNDKPNIINYNDYFDENCSDHECTYTYTIKEEDFNVIIK